MHPRDSSIAGILFNLSLVLSFGLCSSTFVCFSSVSFKLHANSLVTMPYPIVNTSVVSTPQSSTLLHWTILQVVDEMYSFVNFFNCAVKPRLETTVVSECRLVAAHVGPDKSSLDPVDVDLPVSHVIATFGKFIKFFVESTETSESSNSVSNTLGSSSSKSYLDTIPERNNKHKLYNSLIGFLNSRDCYFSHVEEHCFGKKLVSTLQDLFWHIDGHHHVFAERATAIPSIFSAFQSFNRPELSKHRKRRTKNMSSDQLQDLLLDLLTIMENPYWERPCWKELKPHIVQLSQAISDYIQYLHLKNKRMRAIHKSPTPVRELAANLKIMFISRSEGDLPSELGKINDLIANKPFYEHLSIFEVLPNDPLKKHRLMNTLTNVGLTVSCMLLVYSPGSNVGNLQFLWKIPENSEPSDCFACSQPVVERIKSSLPVYHTRAMKRAMFEKFGRVSNSVKPAILRYFYKDLTGDSSGSSTTDQAEIDHRIQQVFEMEDPDILLDLREHNSGKGSSKFNQFWDKCQEFLSEEVGSAVDDRRHGQITHLARAISVRDFAEQVKRRCPPDTPIPSDEWLRLQFWPKTHSAKAKQQHTGRFKLKFMVQQRQWRKSHPDAHFAAACFRYIREYAVKLRDHCNFVCMDDKHRIKVGEPGFPVASAERGRRVPVRQDEYLTVGDHDFTKFGLIPSVIFIVDVPEEVDSESWYKGAVYVGLKGSVFESSSPIRHACELYNVLTTSITDQTTPVKPVLFLYTDGGPDHRLTYISVQLSLITLFLKLDLDFLCAARTAPFHSWRNPVERIMSILNLGLQCVGIARSKMAEELEAEVSKCNNMTEIRKIASNVEGLREAVIDSLSPVKCLLSSIFIRLKLHDKFVSTFTSASLDEINTFWTSILAIDASLVAHAKYTRRNIEDHSDVLEFITHCCRATRYTFDILKCDQSTCKLCKPVRLSASVFSELRHLPLPILGEDGHYLPFIKCLYSATNNQPPTTEATKKATTTRRKKNTLPFYASVQHAKNSGIVIQCEECFMWRVVYSKYHLNKTQQRELQSVLDEHSYSCGAKLIDLGLPESLENVEIKNHDCHDMIERLYYSAKYEPICIHCGQIEPYTSDSEYPRCQECAAVDKPIIKKTH